MELFLPRAGNLVAWEGPMTWSNTHAGPQQTFSVTRLTVISETLPRAPQMATTGYLLLPASQNSVLQMVLPA